MEEKFNINELIELKQLPKIFYQLEQIGNIIDTKLIDIDTMEVTEENKQEVKKRKAEINKLNDIMETKRKEIKKQILEDYEVFNQKYEETIKTKLNNASKTLKDKIDLIELEQKNQKEEIIKEFANEYIINLHLEGIVEYKDLNVSVTLSASEKSLKSLVKAKLEDIANDVNLINLEEYKEEILLEYKNNLDFAKSKLSVIERHNKIEQLKLKQEEVKEVIKEEEKIQEIIAPIEIKEEDNQMMIYTFTITGTKEQIIKVRDYLRSEGINYE